ncbi:MAG TPA: adenylate/guanylate cyclase domain-containing protein [Hyphomicrobium sp.]|nr:adenylate/guanylate cyclase domain-containing protein [Hyphomicrobium sp.]
MLLLAAVVLRIADPEPVARMRLSVFDTYLNLAPRTPDSAYPVRIVDIDDASLARLGQWPWPRSHIASIVDRLKAAGARTVTLDLILAEPDRLSPAEFAKLFAQEPALAPLVAGAADMPSNDARLAEAIASVPSVLGLAGETFSAKTPPKPRASFAIAGDDPLQFVPRFSGSVQNLPLLTQAAKGLGAVNWLPERDQVVRRVPLLISIAGVLYPSLPLETLRLALGETTVFMRSSGASGAPAFGQRTGIEHVRVGSIVLPTDADGQLWLRFTRPDPQRYISAHRVLDGSIDAKEIAGRDILVGASAVGLLDLRATPLDAAVPGVEVHAQALEQMLRRDHLTRPAFATGLELIILLFAGAALAWLIGRMGAAGAAAVGIAAIALVFAASWFAYTERGYLLDPVYPSLAVLLVYLATSLTGYIATERERSRVRSAFGHYIAAPLVEELARNHDRLKLGGEMREVTLLFADVRGFTGIAEGLSAEELIAFLNRLFTPLSEIILEERGTIDKFIGDAVMAFWNAPLTDLAHAANACRAALRMQEQLAQMNRLWAAEAAAAGQQARRVSLGIGLNTGQCCVGNVGSPQRFDYSILGDVVNIAARLEGETKTYGVPIITGERTRVSARGFAFLELGTVKVRGKERVERIYALIGDDATARSAEFIALAASHARLLSALLANDRSTAAAALSDCRHLGGARFAALYDCYAARLDGSASAAV